jgi:8-oxo-dGTP pyrophosphatase MutT (NUDIX family)
VISNAAGYGHKTRVSPYSPDTPPPLMCPELKPVFLTYENPWFRVMSRGSYYTVEYERPQVVIVPVLENDSIVMVRVKRPLIDDCPLELPAGDSCPGETPRMAAIREFAEETGIRIENPLRFVPQLPLSEMPGRMPVLLSIFRVDLARSEFDSRLDTDDDIASVEVFSLVDAARRITTGEIYLSSPTAILSRLIFGMRLDRLTSDEEQG